MPKKTEHYQLNQYEPQDSFLRADFNKDNAKIDAALAGKCSVVFGHYIGDGASVRTISLGFTPSILYSCSIEGNAGEVSAVQYIHGGLCAPGYPVGHSLTSPVVEIVEGGFRVRNNAQYVRANLSGTIYYYLAFTS